MESEHFSISIEIEHQPNKFHRFFGLFIQIFFLTLILFGLLFLSYHSFSTSNIENFNHSIVINLISENSSLYNQFNYTNSTTSKPVITTIKPNHSVIDNSFWNPI